MKIRTGILLLYLALIFSACSKNNNPNPDPGPRPNPTGGGGKVTEAGVPDGTPVTSKVIGAAGGELVSHDGALKVNIPAGALSADQTLKIQRISGKSPLSTNNGYRLEPHGIRFAKPVTLTIHGGDSLLSGTFKEAVSIAYRNDKGIWMARPDAVVNTSTKTVSVTTTHFSDWEIIKIFYIRSPEKMMEMGSSMKLEAMVSLDLVRLPLKNEAELDAITLPESQVKSWKLSGRYGSLRQGANKAEVFLDAPNYLASRPHNPVTVNLELQGLNINFRQVIVLKEIEVTAGFLEYRIAGGAWKKIGLSPPVPFMNIWRIVSHDGDFHGTYFSLQWPGNTGSFPYSGDDNTGNTILLNFRGGDMYISRWIDKDDEENQVLASRGAIQITSPGNTNGEYLKGTFVIENAGMAPTLKTQRRIEGRFQVLRQQ